jgi:hypothetical protein
MSNNLAKSFVNGRGSIAKKPEEEGYEEPSVR